MVQLLVFALLAIGVILGTPLQKLEEHIQSDGRIIGGRDVDIVDYPYQLRLSEKTYGSFCGAILISEDWALTATHCILEYEAENLRVRAGSSFSDSGGELIQVKKKYEHADYAKVNDITLLKLSSKVTISTAKSVQLATSKPKAGEIATVTGWGILEFDTSKLPDVLQAVDIPIVSEEDCQSTYGDIPQSMICAGDFDNGGKDSCSGDSGGPLVVNGTLVGIVSWGNGCGFARTPGVYTNVPFYLDWIKEIMSSEG